MGDGGGLGPGPGPERDRGGEIHYHVILTWYVTHRGMQNYNNVWARPTLSQAGNLIVKHSSNET